MRIPPDNIILAKNGTTLQKWEYHYGQINPTAHVVDTSQNNGKLAEVDSWIGTTQEYRQQFNTIARAESSIRPKKYGTGLGSTTNDLAYKYDRYDNRQQRYADNSGNTTLTQKWVESTDYDTTNNNNQFIEIGSTPVSCDDTGKHYLGHQVPQYAVRLRRGS